MIRFKSGDLKGVPSGYERPESPTDLTIPPCGLGDVDRAIFEMFDKELNFEVGEKNEDVKKVPVVYASGEKWALIKKSRALRDKNDTLKLPLISIVRTSIEQRRDVDIAGRGINQQTGEIVIKRRLSSTDRDYQNLINRLYVKNQDNLSQRIGSGVDGQLETIRETGDRSLDYEINEGAYLAPDRTRNIWETISIPSPQFYTAKYKITFWTQYNFHMNQLIEKFMSSLLTPGNCLRLETPKGYWFIAYFEDISFEADTNFSDQSEQERMIKHSFEATVPAYILASRAPGIPVPVRRTLSSPSIQFTIENSSESAIDETEEDGPYIGADDPTLPSSLKNTKYSDKRQRQPDVYPRNDLVDKGDPALQVDEKGRPYRRGKYVKRLVVDRQTGKLVEKYVRSSQSHQGEESLGGFSIEISKK
jgi:hypothetical protein